ncbi:MAG: GntR family transcriptional regulator, partial [Mycobacterium sp.]|nr:GntR family transcriptional regulator [Mycobacterium sp.]
MVDRSIGGALHSGALQSGALHSSVVSALGKAIVSGQYPPGHILTLDGLGAERGVSRSVAREAIRVLESM